VKAWEGGGLGVQEGSGKEKNRACGKEERAHGTKLGGTFVP
jgi:hypothetical protein